MSLLASILGLSIGINITLGYALFKFDKDLHRMLAAYDGLNDEKITRNEKELKKAVDDYHFHEGVLP